MKIYIIKETCEDSEGCTIHGAWRQKKNAYKKFTKIISENVCGEFNEDSYINNEAGIAQSDPEYSAKTYTNLEIKELLILD